MGTDKKKICSKNLLQNICSCDTIQKDKNECLLWRRRNERKTDWKCKTTKSKMPEIGGKQYCTEAGDSAGIQAKKALMAFGAAVQKQK